MAEATTDAPLSATAAQTLAPGLYQDGTGAVRCFWCEGDPLYEAYHDREWGRPTADDRYLFEKLCLEGFQAGLSWLTILRKRESFRAGFANFEPAAVAAFGEADVEQLLADAGIVRHRAKILSTINNARRALALIEEAGSLAAFLWQFEPQAEERPTRFDKASLMPITFTAQSTALSKALKSRGWTFVGPTTMHAFMQAVGMVNDHIEGCSCRADADAARRAFVRPV